MRTIYELEEEDIVKIVARLSTKRKQERECQE